MDKCTPSRDLRTPFHREEGLAFVAILVILVTLIVLGLAFLSRTGRMMPAVMGRNAGMQARYSAESAAAHALWRVLNEPGFSPSETVYTMHDLAGGRYGYKVRRPTLTRFGSVATVGATGNAVVRKSYVQYIRPRNILTVYDRASTAVPRYRQLLGATFTAPADTVNDGSNTAQWVVLRGSPVRREMVMGTLDTANDITLAVWDGTAWANAIQFTASSLDTYKCMDIAYENLSGEALVVGRHNAGEVRYNIWDGNAWASATALQDGDLNPESNLSFVDMASRPNSDEIMVALLQTTNDLKLVHWDGSGFIDHGEIDTSTESDRLGGVEIVCEQQSGDVMILWGHRLVHRIYYTVWDGILLGPVGQLPDFGNDPKVIRAASEPAGDCIFAAAVDDSQDLNVAVWDGDAWIDSRELETDTFTSDTQVFDIAWEDSGEEVVIVWARVGEPDVRYFTWQKGTALADHPVKTGPDFLSTPRLIRLQPVPGSQKIVLLGNNNSNNLCYSLWSGNTFLGNPAVILESNLAWGSLPFDIDSYNP